jgi:hypothetical protein
MFLSKVGDVALDVPDANVIIQISSHFGSRLQEAQRMGRILRRGSSVNASSGANSFFYTLISTDTLETYFANKRRRYLVDQGYAYIVRPADALADKAAVDALVAAQAAELDAAAAGVGGGGSGGGGAPEPPPLAVGEGGGVDAPDGGGTAPPPAPPSRRAFTLDSPTGLEALRRSATFMTDPAEQLRVLELVLRNSDAEAAAEDRLWGEEAPEDTVVRGNKDAAKAAALARAGAGGGGALGRSGAADITTRTLAGRAALPAASAAAPPSSSTVTSSIAFVPGAVRREGAGLAGLSGGAGLAYLEYDTGPGGGSRAALARLEAGEQAERLAALRAARAAGAGGGGGGGPKPPPAANPLDALY